MDFQEIPPLLHDSQLVFFEWDAPLACVRLFFSCLRRDKDGASIDDPVELRLQNVEAIAACYSPPDIEVRPSLFTATNRIELSELSNWNRSPLDAELSINSETADFYFETACLADWLVSSGQSTKSAQIAQSAQSAAELTARLRVHLVFDSHFYSTDASATAIFIACESIEGYSNGISLSVDLWTRQYEAWWDGWKQHWGERDSSGERTGRHPTKEEIFIPACENEEPALAYRPPQREAFAVSATDAPADLLEPIHIFHAGVLRRDWMMMARAYPNLDQTTEERAVQLGEWYLSDAFGRWSYIRQVDSWWAEGFRACVVVRGIEHAMPDEDDPAENNETVLTYGLRKRHGRWFISTWSQGWPKFSSAPPSETNGSWRKEWDLADDQR